MLHNVMFDRPEGTIKYSYNDFIVREVVNKVALGAVTETRLEPRAHTDQQFTLMKLTKRGIESGQALKRLSRELEVYRDALSISGIKDAYAITTQLMVVEGGYVPRCSNPNLLIQTIGPTSGHLQRGQHDANYFSIHVRTDALRPAMPIDDRFLNLFGPQRFGDGRITIGKFLLLGEYETALELLDGSQNWGSLQRIMKRYDYSALEALHSSDFAFERKFLVTRWRSWLWNQLAALLPHEVSLPLWDAGSAPIYAEHGLCDLDPSVVAEKMRPVLFKSSRPVRVKAYAHQVEQTDAGWRHKFALQSGAYATTFLSEMYDLYDHSRQSWLDDVAANIS